MNKLVGLWTLLVLAIALCAPVSAHTRYHAWHHSYGWNSSLRALPAPCRQAARMGGPCGCFAASVLLGTTEHVARGINLWLANAWLSFPHVAPGAANAVVWPGRHVAPVVPGSFDGRSVVVNDSWGTHTVSARGLVFVRASL